MTPDEIKFLKIIRSLDTDKLEKAVAILKSFAVKGFSEDPAQVTFSPQE